MGGITDLYKTVSELENKVKVSQEEIKSLHQLTEQLEKRLQQLELKGEISEAQIQPANPYFSCLLVRTIRQLTTDFMGLMSLYDILPHG